MDKKLLLSLGLFVFGLQTTRVQGQGSLTPPGAPAPTMKTLSQIEPRTPISTLPYTISAPGSYYVATNLIATINNAGLTISSGNVTVDLNGFTLNGAKTGSTGVYVSGSYTNIAIRNGILTSWNNTGIDAYTAGFPRQVRLENLSVFGTGGTGIFAEADTIIRNCQLMGNGGDGIYCFGGEIIDCICRNNTSYGFDVVHCTVRNCRAEYNSAGGMFVNDCRVFDCASDNNGGQGIYNTVASLNEVRRCHIAYNGSNGGIVLGVGSGYISDCLIANNTGVGIAVSGQGYVISGNICNQNTTGGIAVNESNNRVEGNTILTPSHVYGISVPNNSYTNNIVVRNSVTGGSSTSFNYNLGIGTDSGPVGSAGAATSPWSNISH